MSRPVRTRAATPDDARAIADVQAAAIRALGTEAYDEEQVAAWLANVHPARYPIGETEAGIRVLVAERDAVVGFGWLECEPPDRDHATGEIVAVYVHPEHTREGIGRQLLRALEDLAREAGCERLVLTASRNAIAFYRRAGYEGVETVALEMQEGVALECLRMRTSLRPTESNRQD
ncbi:GNAT family N-acetyltransferase [Salinadaptatus halalkaliphilus]|uniref:GNAT family N-acetyltransferase n=1 Tax=Salinadaptatus halalkaliphilus TaxID=2419781 RepID=A0A4S3TKX1_9EURY|nr:GNAT family N-acetyltransferase [Salinadaptatus halalkaliphilus]THE63883.1 GNAT family N-acetyltransferase [Salinadaptatus halalkaliphilus]